MTSSYMPATRLPQASSTNGDAAGGASAASVSDRRGLVTEFHERVRNAFDTIDNSRDGTIDVLHLKAALDLVGLELRREEMSEMLGNLAEQRGEPGRAITRVTFPEFARLAAEKLHNDSAEMWEERPGGPRDAEGAGPDVPGQLAAILEAAGRRAQSTADRHLNILQKEVTRQMEALANALREDHTHVQQQLSDVLQGAAVLQKDSSRGTRRPQAWPTISSFAKRAPPVPFGGPADEPKPPDVEPFRLKTAQVVVPPGVVSSDTEDGGSEIHSVGAASVQELYSAPEGEDGPRRRNSALNRRATILRRCSVSGQAAVVAFDALQRKKGRNTLRTKVMEAAMGGDRESGSMLSEASEAMELMRRYEAHGEVERIQEESDARRNVFADVNTLKDQVRTALIQNKYDVKDLYKTTGVVQFIARSSFFEILTLLMVITNSIWIWIDADLNQEPVLAKAPPLFQVMENTFCLYFLAEWSIRFCAFAKKRDAMKDGWFIFDTFLVFLTVCETWILSLAYLSVEGSLGMNPSSLKIFFMLRLTRMARMARLLRWMPELLIILKGLWMASKSVLFTLVLLFFTIYIFGIAFRQLTDSTPVGDQYFQSVHGAMVSLFLRGTIPDLADMVLALADEHLGLGMLLVLFILFATLTIMNMLVGVLVEVVSTVSTIEHETLVVNMVRAKMLQMIDILQLDLDGNGALSKTEFEALLVLPEAAQFIQEVGVDVVGLVEYADFFFKDQEMSFADFVELILQLRGTNQASVKDIVDLRKQVMQELERSGANLDERLAAISKQLEDAMAKLDGLQRAPASPPVPAKPPLGAPPYPCRRALVDEEADWKQFLPTAGSRALPRFGVSFIEAGGRHLEDWSRLCQDEDEV